MMPSWSPGRRRSQERRRHGPHGRSKAPVFAAALAWSAQAGAATAKASVKLYVLDCGYLKSRTGADRERILAPLPAKAS